MKFAAACLGSFTLILGGAFILGVLTNAPALAAMALGGLLVWVFRHDIENRRRHPRIPMAKPAPPKHPRRTHRGH